CTAIPSPFRLVRGTQTGLNDIVRHRTKLCQPAAQARVFRFLACAAGWQSFVPYSLRYRISRFGLRLLLLSACAGHREELTATRFGAAAQLPLGGTSAARFGRRFRAFLFGRTSCLPTQTDLAIGRVHAQNPHFDLIADLDDILGTFDLVIGQFRDVQQAFQARFHLDEHAKVRQLCHLALLDLAGLVATGDVAFPRIVIHLLQPQGDALALLIDVEDDARHLVALVDDFAGVGHLTNPTHVADVQQTIDTFLDFDESAVVGEVAHRAADDGSLRIAFGDLVPRIGLYLLHAQRDFLLVLIDVEDLHFNLIADGNQFAGMVDAFGPAHLADVNQSFDAWFQFDEGTVAHDVDHFAGVLAVDRILLGSVGPRAGRLLLQTQRDLFFFAVHLDDEHFQFLVDVNHVVRVVHSSPTHVADMQQAIDTAQVHEGTELRDVLDDALAHL